MVKIKLIYSANFKGDKTMYEYNLTNVDTAIKAIQQGDSIRTTAKDHGVPYESLRRFVIDGLPQKLKVKFLVFIDKKRKHD